MWIKRFEIQYGQVAAGFVVDNFNRMMENGVLLNSEFKTMIANYYSENDIPINRRPSLHKISEALKEYSEHHGLEVTTDNTARIHQFTTAKARKFLGAEAPF